MNKVMLLKWMILYVILLLKLIEAEHEPSPPLIVSFSRNIRFHVPISDNDTEQTQFMIQCYLTYTHPPPVFDWTKNGETFDWSSTNGRIVQEYDDEYKILELIFNRPISSDAGVYQCFATNDYGTSHAKPINITEGGTLSFHSESQINAQLHHPAKLECDIPNAYDRDYISWYRLQIDNERNTYETTVGDDDDIKIDPNGNLLFLRVSRDDGSNSPYYCTYSMNYGCKRYNGSNIYLAVIDDVEEPIPLAPQPLYISPKNVIVTKPGGIYLCCYHGGYPKPNITWTINGTESEDYINQDSFYLLFQEEYITGTFACHVSNGVGSDLTHTFEVSVEPYLFWSEYQFSVKKAEGENAEFKCVPNSNWKSTSEWFINGKPITEIKLDDRWSVTTNLIVISNLQASDMSVIGCRVTLGNKSLYDENDLRVMSKAPVIQFDNEKKNNEILWFINDTGNMNCDWEAAPIPTVQWFKNGNDIERNDRVNFTNTALTIESVTEEDAGEYECKVTNKYGSDSFKTVINVYNKTNIKNDIENVETTIGSTVKFPCHVEVDKRLTNVTVYWKFNYYQIAIDDDHVVEDDNSLKITNVKESDDGTYYCQIERNGLVWVFGESGQLIVKT